jgi:hypothetical protein
MIDKLIRLAGWFVFGGVPRRAESGDTSSRSDAPGGASAGAVTGLGEEADRASARAYAAPGAPGAGVFDRFVDSCNRLVRPAVSLYILGGLAGWWTLPDLSRVDERWLAAGQIVLVFWFGGRAILKDLPAGVAAAIAAYAKMRGR